MINISSENLLLNLFSDSRVIVIIFGALNYSMNLEIKSVIKYLTFYIRVKSQQSECIFLFITFG